MTKYKGCHTHVKSISRSVKPKLKCPLLPKLKCPHMWRLKVDRIYNMSAKEIRKTEIMSQLARKQITQIEAAKRLGISVRQVKRIWKRYQESGPEGLMHKSRGRRSHNQMDEELKK